MVSSQTRPFFTPCQSVTVETRFVYLIPAVAVGIISNRHKSYFGHFLQNMICDTEGSLLRAHRGYRDSARLLGESCWQKNWGAIRGKHLHGNREIVVEWTVGGWEHTGTDIWLKAQIGASPRTKYKLSKNVFAVTSIALSLGHLGPRLLELLAQSLIGSPGTLGPPHHLTILWLQELPPPGDVF